jgi:cytosine/adenosine deaminase-related metal-dependent hydrolase
MVESNHWLLTGARIAQNPRDACHLDIQIQAGRIHFVEPKTSGSLLRRETQSAPHLDLSGMLILPGLINAHDHLEFALFPRLGNGVYANAWQWALDIYHPDRSPICELLQIPKSTRLFWGGLKNLLSGVTTVCHHNHYEPEVFENDFPTRVLKRFGWSHSFDFSRDVSKDFYQTPQGAPFFIHLAEGTDAASRGELDSLDRLGLLNSQTVLIHGVALNPGDWERVKLRKACLVWCPSSNLFTLGRTVENSVLQSGISVALGNDSPLTAAGDLLDEIHCASQLQLTPEEIYAMVTRSAAQLMGLDQGEGEIVQRGVADLILVKDTGVSPALRLAQLTQNDIELVMLKGRVLLASPQLVSQLPPSISKGMQKLSYAQRECFVSVNLLPHWQETRRILGDNSALAAKGIRIWA